jgi:hypothetical protein
MPPTAQHEALHRIFQHDEALFARTVARVFNVMVPAPVNVTVLGTDLTETEPIERRPDSVLQAEFMVEESAGKYILIIESQTDPDDERRRRWPHYIAHLHDKYGVYRDGARRHRRPADMEGTDGDPDLPVRIGNAPASS